MVILGKLPVVQMDKKFPAIYGTTRFITVFARAHKFDVLRNIS
jgi:hypothetical protein